MLIRLLTALIPFRSIRRRVRRRLLDRARDARVAAELPRVRARYTAHEAECRRRLAAGGRLRVAFLVCDASMFSGESVLLRLREDPRFEPFIAVAPRVTRGERFLRETLEKTCAQLEAKYGAVTRLYDPETRRAEHLEADIVFSTVIYEDQTLADYTTERLSHRALVAMLYYGYGGLVRTNETKTPYLPNLVFAWRYFVSNEANRRVSVAANARLAANTLACGYTKMDRLADLLARAARERTGRRPKVVLAPHHTIERGPDGLRLSTFIANAELYQELPREFPEIDFVFRPHPLLFPRLATAKWWGEERTAEYRRRLEANANVEFQQGGDYFATFAESDALIHDCGSFLAEYFYTGRPQCYLLENAAAVEEQFLPFARRLFAHVTPAYDGAAVRRFLRETVLGGNDPDREARVRFAREEVCVNHPDATGGVIAAVLRGIERGEL